MNTQVVISGQMQRDKLALRYRQAAVGKREETSALLPMK